MTNFETSQRTVLPPTKRTASNNKQPLVNTEIHISTFQEDEHNRLSEESNVNDLQQKLLWTTPHKCGKLSSSYSLDQRMVLPKAQLNTNDGHSHRTVILPKGKPNSPFLIPTKAAMQHSHTSSTSKLMTARQACEEELEFLKLKLRYMLNDIEFKQKQLDSAKTSKPKCSTISRKWIENNQHISAQVNPGASFSNYNLTHPSNLQPRQSPKTWTTSLAAGKQIKSMGVISDKHQPSGVTFNYHSYVTSKSNESVITKCSTFPMVAKSNNSSTLYSWSSYSKDRASSDIIRQTCSSSDFKKVHSDYKGTLSSHTNSVACVSNLTSVPSQLRIVTQNSLKVTPAHHTTAGSTTTTFDRSSKVLQPVKMSPDKRFVLLPSKTVPAEISATETTQKTFQSVPSQAIVKNYSVNNNPHSLGVQNISSYSHSGTCINLNTDSEKTSSTTSLSKYKLIKSTSSLPANMTKTPSTNFNSTISLPSHVDSSNLHECPSYILPTKAATTVRRASQASKLSLRGPSLKIQTAAKLVSKYKLKRLSPTSASLTAPLLYNSKAQCKKFATDYEQEYHKLFGPYNRHQHKLEQRPMLNNLTIPTIILKIPMVNTDSVQTKAHKIDRRPFYNQSFKISRNTQRPLVRSKLKIDKRVKRSNVSLHKLGSEEIQNVHSLDRRNIKYDFNKLKASPRQGTKHCWISSAHINNSTGGGASSSGTKGSASKFNWKTTNLMPLETSCSATSQNSRFKWSRPNLQAQNGAWQQLRQKLQLMLNKKYQHSRCKFFRYPWLTSVPSIRASKFGDSKTNLVKIDGIMYKSSRRKLTRARRYSCQTARKIVPVQNSRCPVTLKSGHSVPASARRNSASHIDVNVANIANRAIHRSKVITAARYKKNNKSKKEAPHCIFFSRFGKCHRGDKCPYVHDPDNVTVCTRFLRGKCDTKSCPFSHKASLNKMPVCLFFLRGICFRENCPYLHVRVNPDAPVCKDFRSGFCALGEKCKKIHSHVCPSFAMTGVCSRAGTCTMLHRMSKREPEGWPPQEESLSRKYRKEPHFDLKKSTSSDSQALKQGTAICAPTSMTTLKSQPSFISLELDPMPSFIALDTSHEQSSGESEVQVPPEKPGLTQQGKVGLSGLDIVQHSSTKDIAQCIRPSFLAKRFTSDKTTIEHSN